MRLSAPVRRRKESFMKELDENQLRGWRLSQPSAGIKRRIFRAQPESAFAPVLAAAWPTWDFSKLAPAMACLLFALMLVHFNGGTWRESRSAVFVNYATGSNAVAFSDHAQERENHLATVTFDWTNKGAIQSSIGSHFGSMPTTNFSN